MGTAAALRKVDKPEAAADERLRRAFRPTGIQVPEHKRGLVP